MSNSPTNGSAAVAQAEPFVYQQVQANLPPDQAGGSNVSKAKAGKSAQATWPNLQQLGTSKPTGKYTEEELQAHLQEQGKQAREQGARDCEAKLRGEYEALLVSERKKVAQTIEEFGRERKTYFEQVEGEVVQLALAVARKILHREAQIDPLFLAGIVRVALEKVASSSSVKLRVAENEVFKWRQLVGTLKGVQPQPEVIGDPTLPAGRCIMETEVGSTNISLDNQFREIERGLLDLLALRPAS